jgi:uncharacterized protein
MKLQEIIYLDLKNAMISKDNDKKNLLRVVIGEFNRIGKEISDDDIIKIIKKMKENAISLNNKIEEDILNNYLPKTLSLDQLEEAISNIMFSNNFSTLNDIGKIMMELKAKYPSQYDGKVASNIIKSKII